MPNRSPIARSGRPRPPRRPVPALAFPLVLLLLLPVAVRAQGDGEAGNDAAGTPTASVVPTGGGIVSTRTGEVPSFGARRAAPVEAAPPADARPEGVRPVAIRIERAAVEAEIEPLAVVDGAMQDPSGPWVVAWYENLAGLGEGGNVVMAGHIDYWNVGPAVFYTVDDLAAGDPIAVTGADGEVYDYRVEWVRRYDAANAPLEEIVGRDAGDALTLITCGGAFDYATGEYLQRTVVRAARQDDAA